LRASLNTEQIVYARAMLLGRAPPREDIPCTKCHMYLKMRKHGRWLDRSVRRALKSTYGNARHAVRLKILGRPLARRIVLRILRKDMPVSAY
jgi:hypothetical protein